MVPFAKAAPGVSAASLISAYIWSSVRGASTVVDSAVGASMVARSAVETSAEAGSAVAASVGTFGGALALGAPGTGNTVEVATVLVKTFGGALAFGATGKGNTVDVRPVPVLGKTLDVVPGLVLEAASVGGVTAGVSLAFMPEGVLGQVVVESASVRLLERNFMVMQKSLKKIYECIRSKTFLQIYNIS